MKKIFQFIVSKRYPILILFFVLAVLCAALMTRVPVNTDMTKYLSDSSRMKQGMDLMEEAFPQADEDYTIRVMFQDLSDTEKMDTLRTLERIEHVSSVDFTPGDDRYQIDNQTLFVVHTSFDYGTPEEKMIETEITSQFSDEEPTVQNDDVGMQELPAWIIVLAILLLVLILLIMCASWIEPVLFLISIGVAVSLNMGTNLIMGEISEITAAIAAILQLVLSMDYSIILINRYRQELAQTENRSEAMINALQNAFSSIVSSSLTTVVGLLALVFMSFKIGLDFGVVLAKGVFFSMICTFTVLPGLILLCDRLIRKTAKKPLEIKTGAFARFSYRCRYPVTAVFVVLFVTIFFFKGNTDIVYTLDRNDPIEALFPPQNPIVLVYDNKDESALAALADELTDQPYIHEISSYAQTLGKEYTASELAEQLAESEGSVAIDPSFLQVVFYDYYSKDDQQQITAGEFLRFLTDGAAADDSMMGQRLDEDFRDNIENLKPLADPDALTSRLSGSELADFFNLPDETVEGLILLYYSEHPDEMGTLTLHEFTVFLSEEVMVQPEYADMIDLSAATQISMISQWTDKEVVTREMDAEELAAFFQMDGMVTAQILSMKFGVLEESNRLTPAAFLDFLLESVDASETLAGSIGEMQLGQLAYMQQILHAASNETEYSPATLSQLLKMEQPQTEQIYLLYASMHPDTDGWGVSVQAFLNFFTEVVLVDEIYAAQLDTETAEGLHAMQALVDAVVSEEKYNAEELAKLLSVLNDGMNADSIQLMMLLYQSENNSDSSWQMSIAGLFDHLTQLMQDPKFESFFDEELKKEITAAQKEINDGAAQLRGEKYARMILNTTFPGESDETMNFIQTLYNELDELDGASYLIGNSVMNYEMMHTFDDEMNFITLLTAIAIFVVIMLTFRSLSVPVILVLVIQCGVYLTVCIIGMTGSAIYYLALLIVQCILMGSTIDYGILFTTYYREKRRTMGVLDALTEAYRGAVHTILTSGSIMVIVTAILGYCFDNPTIGQICLTISKGALCATILILFVLPGLLAAFDKLTAGKNRKRS